MYVIYYKNTATMCEWHVASDDVIGDLARRQAKLTHSLSLTE